MPRWQSAEVPDTPGFSADVVDRVAAVVRRHAGLAFDPARRTVLEAGLRTAMSRAETRHPERYLDRLEQEPNLLDALIAEITIGETYFFRDDSQFALLRERIFPDLFRTRSFDTPLRIWSAGCATGEEPYSLAMLLHEFGQLNHAEILGTDIARPALHRARQARYSSWSLRGVSDEVVRRYFTRAGDRVVLRPEIRRAVDFRYLNLADDGYPSAQSGIGGMNLVLCRNVLIYVAAERIPEIARRMLDSLSPDGWLMLGSTDPLLTGIPGIEAEITSAGLVYRRQSNTRSSGPSRSPVLAIPDLVPAGTTASERSSPVDCPTPVPAVDPAEAARWYAEGEYRRAADGASAALASGLDSIAIRVLLINALVNCQAFEEAEQACRTAREHHGDCAELAALHAFVLVEAGNQREAEMIARQALYLDPNLPLAHLAMGATLMVRRDTSGAHRSLRHAERLSSAQAADVPSVESHLVRVERPSIMSRPS